MHSHHPPKLRLTEEEKSLLIKKETARRRILRLKQVKEQSSMHAKVIREVVSQRKREIVEDLRAELHVEVEAKIQELTKNGALIATQPKSNYHLSGTLSSTRRRSKSKTPRRKRKLTHEDLEKIEKRSQTAIKRLRDGKNQLKKEKELKLNQRIEAERQANRILKEGTGGTFL